MPDRISEGANWFETTLTAEMNGTTLTATVSDTTGVASPAYIVIEPDVPAQREVIYMDDTFTGTTFVTTALGNRYLAGSGAGSGLTHPNGSVVRVTPVFQHIEDLWDGVVADRARLTTNEGDITTLQASSHAEAHTVASHSDTTATGAELETLTDGSAADSLHTHANLHAESHTVASHSDTTATGTELETLTDGSNADALHAHAGTGAGGDTDAIHDNVANEITAVTLKGSPVAADEILIEDSAAGFVKKSATLGTLPVNAHTIASHSDTTATGAELETLTDGSDADALHTHSADGIDTSAIHDNTASEISAITEKTTPVDADLLLIEDSAATNAKKRVQVGNLPKPVQLKTFIIPGEAAAGTLTAQWYHGRRAITIEDVFAYCDNDGDPTGSATVGNVYSGGTTIYSAATKPQIAAGADEDAAVRAPDTTAIGATSPITFGIDSVGTTGAVNMVFEVAYTVD